MDGSVSGNTVPGRITFNTTLTSTNLTERLRITSAGLIGANISTPAAALDSEVNQVVSTLLTTVLLVLVFTSVVTAPQGMVTTEAGLVLAL